MNAFEKIAKYRQIERKKDWLACFGITNIGSIRPEDYPTKFKSINHGEFVCGEEFLQELIEKYNDEK